MKQALTTRPVMDFVGEFEVRGRQSGIRLWTLANGQVAADLDVAEARTA